MDLVLHVDQVKVDPAADTCEVFLRGVDLDEIVNEVNAEKLLNRIDFDKILDYVADNKEDY